MRPNTLRHVPLLLGVCGLGMGMVAGVHTRDVPAWSLSSVASTPAKPSFRHRAPAYSLDLEPVRLSRSALIGRDSLVLGSTVRSNAAEKTRTMIGVRIVDDRGREVQPAALSKALELAQRTELSGLELTTSNLPDGWFRIIGEAAFVQGGAHVGSAIDEVYVRVVDGNVEIVDMEDWYAQSQANAAVQEGA